MLDSDVKELEVDGDADGDGLVDGLDDRLASHIFFVNTAN